MRLRRLLRPLRPRRPGRALGRRGPVLPILPVRRPGSPRPGRSTATPPGPALGVHRHRRLPARDAARPPDRGAGRPARGLPARRRDGQHQAGGAAGGPRPHPRRGRETVGGQQLCGHRDDRAGHAARRRRRGPRPGHPGRDGARPAARAALGPDPAVRHQRCAARAGLLQRLAVPADPGRDRRRRAPGAQPAGAAGTLPGCRRRRRAGAPLPAPGWGQRQPAAGLPGSGHGGGGHARRPGASRPPTWSAGPGWRASTTPCSAA